MHIKQKNYSNIAVPMNKLFIGIEFKFVEKMGSLGLKTSSSVPITYEFVSDLDDNGSTFTQKL